ncbi:hypothetical protein AB5I41_19630 [Sphingomonas sp. MMS24-JH45]
MGEAVVSRRGALRRGGAGVERARLAVVGDGAARSLRFRLHRARLPDRVLDRRRRSLGGSPIMLAGVAEKLAFGVPALWFAASGRAEPAVALFGTIDLVLGAGFFLAWRVTPRT